MQRDDAIPLVRIFISSPGDVSEERAVALAVIRRLQGHFQGRLRLVPVLWEQEPLLATAGFQEEIERRIPPSESDVAVFILWSRLGTPLSERFRLEDGRRPGGTEWEFTEAARAAKEKGSPHVLVYRKTAEAVVSLTREAEPQRRLREAQFDALSRFFETRFRDAEHLTFKGSYHTFDDASAFGQLLDEHLTKELSERVHRDGRPPATWHEAPFRGLEAFGTEHAPIYFGRTRAIHAVRQALAQQVRAGRAFVLILGPSGNGKSSLARAGLLPLLSGPWVVEDGVTGGFCRTAVLRPAEAPSPLTALAQALLATGALPDLATSGDAARLAAALASGPDAAVALVRGALVREGERAARTRGEPHAREGRLVVLADQLEEIFTREGVTNADREAFAGVLDALARSGLVWVLATLRSDFYPAYSTSAALMALKQGAGQYDLPPPDASEVAQVVRGPALAAGLRYEVRAGDGRGLDDVLVEAGCRAADALPLLEFLLTQLWERRRGDLLTFEAYAALGGLEGALATHAEATWGALGEEARSAFPRVVRGLVEVGEGAEAAATRRRAAYAEVAATAAERALVDALVQARLFVADGAGAERVLSVAHEALLRGWPRLAEQLRAETELLRIRSRLRSQAARWDALGRENSLLLTLGKPLGEARLLQAARFGLTALESQYIDASEARARRITWVKRGAVAVIALLALLASGLAVSASHARRSAEALRDQALADSAHVLDLGRLRVLRAVEETLYPVRATDAIRLEYLLEGAEGVIARLGSYERELADLVARATDGIANAPEDDGWFFETDREAAVHRILAELVREARTFADPTRESPMRRLRDRFRASGPPYGGDWDVTAEEIRDTSRNPIYGGLRVPFPFGFHPLGKDPISGLFEFAHVYSGTVPSRDDLGQLVLTEDSAIVFVLLPGGTYARGAEPADRSLAEGGADAVGGELPLHDVRVSAFFLAKHECTQAQWARLSEGSWPSEAEIGRIEGVTRRHPVEHVSWEDCEGRPGWLRRYGLRLPTEAEWEFAARCPLTSTGQRIDRHEPFSGGLAAATAWQRAALTQLDARRSEPRRHSMPVGSYAPNEFGLHDMAGNVREWCHDWFDGGTYARLTAAGGVAADPRGPAREELRDVSHRVMRGGSWKFDVGQARSAYRTRGAPTLNFGFIGCRPARSLAP